MDKYFLKRSLYILLVFISSCISIAYASDNLVYGKDMEGGKVACLKSDGGIDNLIAAKSDISDGITWGGQGIAVGPAAQSDTDGLGNSMAIIAKLGTKTQYAALLCQKYQVDSDGNTPCLPGNTCYNDWFLPSRYQLDCLHKNKAKIGGFKDDFYWTSSEFAGYPGYSSWDKFFGDGEHASAGEDDMNRVRCVRYYMQDQN